MMMPATKYTKPANTTQPLPAFSHRAGGADLSNLTIVGVDMRRPAGKRGEEMKCEICNNEAMSNSIVCSEHCEDIRQKMRNLTNKFFPTNGCENCWGDLHQDCTEKCKEEFRIARIFNLDLRELIDSCMLQQPPAAPTGDDKGVKDE